MRFVLMRFSDKLAEWWTEASCWHDYNNYNQAQEPPPQLFTRQQAKDFVRCGQSFGCDPNDLAFVPAIEMTDHLTAAGIIIDE